MVQVDLKYVKTKTNKAHCTLKYISKLSLLAPHEPAKHRNSLVEANRDLTPTGTPILSATAARAGSRGTQVLYSLVLIREFVVEGVGPRLHSLALLRGVYPITPARLQTRCMSRQLLWLSVSQLSSDMH